MINKDTIKLLKECNRGIKMGIGSIEEIFNKIKSRELKYLLKRSIIHHKALLNETDSILKAYRDNSGRISPAIKAMAWFHINIRLIINKSDKSAADLLISGCDNGIKHLSKYLNQYKAADEKSKNICKELIAIEEELSKSLREYL